MKRTGFKQKFTTPLKRTPFKARCKKLRLAGVSDTKALKDEIQALAREIVIIRDGGCILRFVPGHVCSGFAKDGHLILQADHLITRSNSATFADTRLIVCICKGAHGWKSVGANMRKNQYDALVKTILPPDRVKLWERCEIESWKPTSGRASDCKLSILALKQELKTYQ